MSEVKCTKILAFFRHNISNDNIYIFLSSIFIINRNRNKSLKILILYENVSKNYLFNKAIYSKYNFLRYSALNFLFLNFNILYPEMKNNV